MGCFLALLALISPRLVLFILAIFSDTLSRAYDSWIVPLLGFFLLPWTTLAYASMWTISSDRVNGAEWVVVGIGFLLDVWAWSAFRRR